MPGAPPRAARDAEQSPLLPRTGAARPTAGLNPRAPSFKLPRDQAESRAHSLVASSAVAGTVAPPEPLPSNAVQPGREGRNGHGHDEHGVDRHQERGIGGADSPAPSTSSLLTAVASRNHSASPHPHPHLHVAVAGAAGQHAPERTPSRRSSLSSLSSLSSRYSLLPLRTFQRLHLAQFALTFLLLFVLPLAVLVAYTRDVQWQAFLLGVASWLAGEQLREVVFELVTPAQSALAATAGPPPAALALPTVVHALAQEALRLGAVALVVKLLPTPPPRAPPAFPPSGGFSAISLLAEPPHGAPRAPLPPLDPLFWSALWLALGSALTEILWGSRRLWKQLELYDEVLPVVDAGAALGEEGVLRGLPRNGAGLYGAMDGAENANGSLVADEDDEDGDGDSLASTLDEEEFQLALRARQRDELEQQLGLPLYEIPVAVVLIWRVDSILLSQIFTLLLSLPFRLTPPSLIPFPLAPTFALVALTHALLAYLWLTRVRSWGVPKCSYASLVLLMAGTFATLGAWGVLE
ncbi:hypothetical protein Rhopal_004081-T1 [Rhodotorula paludigena]|uniref:Uncharacterized protein n=1 Tax=Rhodotorula paludigena TaxID=86838 RepID=A0AAV5GET5_9BASI|nr:hypothetical protein Rhopal_004081-T1 [Rhodotorula paludigena]